MKKILSGGQTGADRGGLDAARALGIEHGGFCPRGRRAEDGIIPAVYNLIELPTASYAARTERNLEFAEAVLIVGASRGGPGTILTRRLARESGKLYRDVDPPCSPGDLIVLRQQFAGVRILMVAGPRESRWPGLQIATRDLIIDLLRPMLSAA